jgi:hypothetical protein
MAGGFIPEITTRITVNVNADSMDDAISRIESDPYLSKCPSIVETLKDKKSQLEGMEQPVAAAVAERLQSNQETIISTKHYITGMMANSVDISQDGRDYLVGNTAHSIEGFPYPLAIETGRREVFPVEKKVLRWFEGGMIGGTPIFARHSGSVTADPFVQPSIDTTIEDIEEIVRDEVRKLK